MILNPIKDKNSSTWLHFLWTTLWYLSIWWMISRNWWGVFTFSYLYTILGVIIAFKYYFFSSFSLSFRMRFLFNFASFYAYNEDVCLFRFFILFVVFLVSFICAFHFLIINFFFFIFYFFLIYNDKVCLKMKKLTHIKEYIIEIKS